MPKIYVSDTWVPREGLFDIRTISLPEVKALLGAFEVVNLIGGSATNYYLVMHLGSVELPAPAERPIPDVPADGLVLLVDLDPRTMVWRFELVRQFDRDEVLRVLGGMVTAVQNLTHAWESGKAEAAMSRRVALVGEQWVPLRDLAARLGGAL